MIYSPDNKFLLLKNYKVGSTSMEVELSKILPKNAIVTEIDPPNPEHKPRNSSGFYNHISYSEIKEKINLDVVKCYIFVRHPYTTVLSDFFFTLKLQDIDPLKLDKDDLLFLLDKYFYGSNWLRSTGYIYRDNLNNSCVDDFLFYENGIENEINRVLPLHGINKIKINTFEKEYRPKHIEYQDMFSKSHIDIINDSWSWEFDNLGYERQ
jgi:hypothetical protein